MLSTCKVEVIIDGREERGESKLKATNKFFDSTFFDLCDAEGIGLTDNVEH